MKALLQAALGLFSFDMINRYLYSIIALILFTGISRAQDLKFTWFNPAVNSQKVVEGQAWPAEVAEPYDRLPARAQDKVREPVWKLSKQSAGLVIRFRSNSGQIRVKYTVSGGHALPHMPATGVSGLDLYAVSSEGEMRWTSGKYSFGDTLSYQFRDIEPNDTYHKRGREYRLYLPLYNHVNWLEIGVVDGTEFTILPPRPDKPILIYGTSIAQGACASRPGMAWPAILGRKLDRPVINLGFSGNGRLEPELIDLISEIDAKVYVLDCLPNLTIRPDTKFTLDDVRSKIIASVTTLRKNRPDAPIVLAEHAGYSDEGLNPLTKRYASEVNQKLREALDSLKSRGISNIYLVPRSDFGQDMETSVDGTHPTDLGMMRYAEGYEKNLRKILKEEIGDISTTKPVTQLREINNYDWEVRHKEILDLSKTMKPTTVVIGNSITHFWGGLPKGPRAVGADSWGKTFGETGVMNLAYGWDRIENVLWRVYHGELDGYTAQRVVVNIGTNNLQWNSNEEIVKGWALLMDAIKNRQPSAKIYFSGIYPRRGQEERVSIINKDLEALAKQKAIKFIDPGKVFLKNGKIVESFFSDGLHPNQEGYRVLGEEIKKNL